jgi:hypothetical protein
MKTKKKQKLNQTIISKQQKKKSKQIRPKSKKNTLKIKKNINAKKSIRIITIDTEKNECKNDMNIFIDLFKKLGYKVDTHSMDINPKLRINYASNPYYDINLFIDRIVPLEFKTIFPSGVSIFMANMNTFQTVSYNHYTQLKNIDSVFCNTKLCYNFINLIKKEHNYTYKAYYTKFTTPIPMQLFNCRKSNSTMTKTKPMIFIHTSDNQIYKNTGSLIHCWLKYNSNSNNNGNTLDCELHVMCHGLCMTTLLLDIKKMYHYDLLNTYTFEKNQDTHSINTILNYKNLYLYLDLTSNDTIYKELINNADVAIYPSKKENYPHSLNTARFLNLFTITLNHQPMNELITSTKTHSNGYLLYKSKLKKTHYPESKLPFIEYTPDIIDLKDSIVWCINNKKMINKYNNSNSGRKMFLDDKKYFENNIKQIFNKLNYSLPKLFESTDHNINFNTLTTNFTNPTYKFYPENEDDNHCKFINIRGIVKSCDIHSLTPISSIRDLIGYEFDFNALQNNKKKSIIYTIYVCNTAIPKFADKLKNDKEFKNLKCRFIVVSGDSDDTCPDDLFENEKEVKQFIENDKIIHWYSQNCIRTTHKKLSQIPIGLAYHHLHNEDIKEEADKIVSPMKQEALLNSIIHKTKQMNMPFWIREVKCYINFNFEKNYMRSRFGYDRYEALTKIPKQLMFSEKNEVARTQSWTTQSKYAFVAAPFGNGLDTHRLWEALILGCIPIIISSGLDSLVEDLPVLIIKDWSDITDKLLMNVIIDFKLKHEKGKFNYDKLTLKFWMDKINSHKD